MTPNKVALTNRYLVNGFLIRMTGLPVNMRLFLKVEWTAFEKWKPPRHLKKFLLQLIRLCKQVTLALAKCRPRRQDMKCLSFVQMVQLPPNGHPWKHSLKTVRPLATFLL